MSGLYPSLTVQIVVLCSICLLSVDNYFGYHAPSAIADEFEKDYRLNTEQFGTLFTIYSAPNIILVFFSGLLVDKYGVRFSSIMFNCLILLGAIICASTPFPSASFPPLLSYTQLLVGRLFIGLGGESIDACSSAMIGKWFTANGFLNTAMAINQATINLLGSAAAFFVLPRINSIVVSQWVTVGVAAISLLSNIVYSVFEIHYTPYLEKCNEAILQSERGGDNDAISMVETSPLTSSSLSGYGGEHTRGSANGNGNGIENGDGEGDGNTPGAVDADNSMQANTNSIISVLKSYPLIFWLVLFHIGLMSPILYTFTAYGPLYLQENFESTRSPKAAGDATSLLYVAIVAAPFTGMAIDYIGYRSIIQFGASLTTPFLFLFLTYGVLTPSVAMFWMGLAYSITEANSLALISLIVPAESQGSAFGLCLCCTSLALLVEPAAVGALREATGSFTVSIWLFTLVTALGSMLALAVWLYDRAHGNLVSCSNRRNMGQQQQQQQQQ